MRRFFCRVAALAALVAPAVGFMAGDGEEAQFFSARRHQLMSRIEGAAALLEGAPETRAYVRFHQDNNFYYLSGVETPGAFLLLDASENRSTLFLPPRDRQEERWEGPRLSAGEETRAATGVDEVADVSRLREKLEQLKGHVKVIYTPFSPAELAETSRDRASAYEEAHESSPWDGRISREKALVSKLQTIFGDSATIRDLSSTLDSMRRIKDRLEIARMREAARIGALGMREAIRAARPGRYEYQIAALAEFFFRWNGAAGPAYFPIIGSGPNSCFIHYNANGRRMEAGDIVLMDFAPEYRYYVSDITRTFPVSNRFTPEQARVYQIVLDAQKAALAKVRPGATLASLDDAARRVIDRAGYAKYIAHGVSHYVGLATHDVGGKDPLEPGVVLTVEPGLYIRERSLGIRIEDTVLVTSDGCEILSADVPKEISQIEALKGEAVSLPVD